MRSTAELAAELRARKAELSGEVAELAVPIRAPGVQVQFGKRAGDHTSDAVMQMERSVAAEQLHSVSVEIDRALAKAGDLKGLRAFEINPVSSSPKAIARYRDLCVIALEARAG